MDTHSHGGEANSGAGSPQQFCLRWHNHQASLLSSLPLLLDQSHLTDVTLIAEGRNIKAHRVVLSACSTFFSELFRTLDGPLYPVVVLPGASFPAVVALLTFMYSGEVNVYEEQISTLLSLAETLGIKGLADFSGNSQKSTTPMTEGSSRESEIPSPFQGIKMESPGESYFPRPFNFHSPLLPQALNLATHSNNNNNTSSSANKSTELFSRFLPQKCDMLPNEALWKMDEQSDAINRGNKNANSNGPSCGSEYRQTVNANNKSNNSITSQPIDKQITAKNDTQIATGGNPKFNLDSNHFHHAQHHDSAPSTPSSNPDEQRTVSSLNTCSAKKFISQENKRKKIDKIAENLRTQTTATAAAAAAAAASFNKHLLQSLKFPPSSQSLSPLHLFSKPPTVTPITNQQPSFLAHHFLTNESASKTPENLILESAHPSPGTGALNHTASSSVASSSCSTSTTITPSMAMDIVSASTLSANSMLKAAAHHLSPSATGTQQKPPTKLYATCFICNKQLSNQYNLRVHLETHQNVRYACTVCSHVSRSKDALRKHVSYRHPGTPSPCDPDTKRKRSKANLGQMIKQEMLTEQNPMSHMIKQEIIGDHPASLSNQQHHNTNQLLANLTSQGNSIVSIPNFLQQAASMQSAFSSKSLLFNSATIPTSLTAPLPPSQIASVCSLNSQPKDLSNPDLSLENTNGSPLPGDATKVSNGPSDSIDDGRAEESKVIDNTP
ncbi:protein tramtrack, beta isoform [Toxorhynchites rutilus septentrionalis]|uniref:protein tramtrack, beta isoform n=1 Tax=Toxorhynchites rutilus septentrionalis TaxID=329112 RepID=UPI0024786F54|nr:protein tramtrack, beta isoform [Toxorhynchites rutilus septentrionalis]XP_055641937.1 protein tramtrack, beta isoform [Toxorhynchites rutilus septentrionalis]XP_055641938.1 protein tramtrack, beta isoform [Toxorhynchites rutilus septentrionalis]XP_055641939.1 protein tramtrack, beta isoform [Toxorhynchites rutilus septentrionalis]XP_055641940.1 protein tramtrack, beta isoform [Toxorhynchites rutilus septentrionalis]XP_055641941.1 protein tramtrack, beta isoform [Toxorhynchites rutilus sept